MRQPRRKLPKVSGAESWEVRRVRRQKQIDKGLPRDQVVIICLQTSSTQALQQSLPECRERVR